MSPGLFYIDKYPQGVYSYGENKACEGRMDMEREKCPRCEKITERSEEEKRRLINRLHRIEGQVRGLEGMIERDAYCTDILTQSAAVSAALNAFNRDLLSRHIRTCVARDLRAGDESVADELADAVQKLMK